MNVFTLISANTYQKSPSFQTETCTKLECNVRENSNAFFSLTGTLCLAFSDISDDR